MIWIGRRQQCCVLPLRLHVRPLVAMTSCCFARDCLDVAVDVAVRRRRDDDADDDDDVGGVLGCDFENADS